MITLYVYYEACISFSTTMTPISSVLVIPCPSLSFSSSAKTRTSLSMASKAGGMSRLHLPSPAEYPSPSLSPPEGGLGFGFGLRLGAAPPPVIAAVFNSWNGLYSSLANLARLAKWRAASGRWSSPIALVSSYSKICEFTFSKSRTPTCK